MIFVGTLILALALVHKPLGDYMARVLTGKRHLAVERAVYRLGGIDADADQTWGRYLRAVLAFSAVAVVFLYGFLRLQHNFGHPYAVPQMSSDQSFNTAASFVTNTNWQSYSGENALGYIVQMAGLAVQNFVSAAVGIAVAIALVRGFARNRTDRLGNFWVDLTRICLRILLPICVVFAIVFVGAGMVENFHHYHTLSTISGGSQTLTGGPVASQEAIKDLGTNGGGFANANSSHPFENPTTWTNWLEIFLLLCISFSLPRTFGKIVGDKRQGYAIVAVMALLAILSVGLNIGFQSAHHGTVPTAVGAATEGHGDPVRGSGLGYVRDWHDVDVDRVGGQLPRFVHQPGWGDAAAEHDARRGGAGRDRIGPVRDLGAGGDHGVRGRVDGRANTRVLGQETRRPGGEVRLAVPTDHADDRSGRHGGRDGVTRPARGNAQFRRARVLRGAVRVHLRCEQ